MKDKKAAKLIIKRAKKHPDWYTQDEVKYAKMVKKRIKQEEKMSDSIKVNQNIDGSFTLEWDKEDPNWKFLNNLTSKEIQVIMQKAIQYDKNDRKIGL